MYYHILLQVFSPQFRNNKYIFRSTFIPSATNWNKNHWQTFIWRNFDSKLIHLKVSSLSCYTGCKLKLHILSETRKISSNLWNGDRYKNDYSKCSVIYELMSLIYNGKFRHPLLPRVIQHLSWNRRKRFIQNPYWLTMQNSIEWYTSHETTRNSISTETFSESYYTSDTYYGSQGSNINQSFGYFFRTWHSRLHVGFSGYMHDLASIYIAWSRASSHTYTTLVITSFGLIP